MGRSWLLLLIGTAMVLLASVVFTLGQHETASAATVTVAVGDNYFANPNPGSHTTTISVGDTVHWNWVGTNNHSVTSDTPGIFDYPGAPTFAVATGTFDFTFNSAGTFNYHCIVHSGMDGTIVVQAATASTPTNTASAATHTAVTGTATASATRTATAAATGTVAATGTPAAATSTPVAVSTAPASGGTGGVTGLPSTGTGGDGGGAVMWFSVALAFAGMSLIGGSAALAVARRRAHGR